MEKRIHVKKLGERIYLMDDAGDATGYLVVGDEKALVIDTMIGWDDINEVVKGITTLPVMVVNTHGHCDHIYGNIYFEEAFLHPDDFELAKEHSNFPEFVEQCEKHGKKMPPFKPILDGEVIDLGGAILDVIHLPGHTQGGICLLYREERVLFTGDGINCHIWMQLEESLTISELVNNLEKLMYVKEKADKILHGHAQDYEDISLLTELYLGAKELIECPECIEQDEDYTWFGGVDKKHIYGPKKNAICYNVGKIKG